MERTLNISLVRYSKRYNDTANANPRIIPVIALNSDISGKLSAGFNMPLFNFNLYWVARAG
jgi:hypothetical protein